MSSTTIAEALYALLTADETLMDLVTAVYRNVAPPAATYPFLLFQHISSNDAYTLTQRVSSAHRYQFKVVDQGYSATDATTAMARVDVLLTDRALDVTSKTLWVMRRIGEFEYAEPGEFGVLYQHVGGDWLIEMR